MMCYLYSKFIPMQAFLALGRWFFAIPFALFGLMDLMGAQQIAEKTVPNYLPFKELWVYLSGVALILGAVSMLLGKYDRWGATGIAVFLFLMIGLLHVPGAISGGMLSETSMTNLLKDMSLAGAALLYAQYFGKPDFENN